MNIKKYLFWIFVSFQLFGCASSNKSHSTYSVFFISPNEEIRLKKKSITGLAEASRRLGEHYYYSLSNKEEAQFWFRLAAEQGSEKAIFSLVNILRETDKDKAIFWISKLISSSNFQKEANATLGFLYEETGDIERANYHRCVSALLGERFSAKQLSDFYLNEEGAEAPEKAYLWSDFYRHYTNEGTQAYKEATSRIRDLSNSLTENQIESLSSEVQKLYREGAKQQSFCKR